MESEASDLIIRPAVGEDIPFLMQLRNRFLDAFLSGEGATVEGTKAVLPEMYVAEIGGSVAGAFSLYNHNLGGSIEFGRFLLEPAYQGRGYGREILKRAIVRAREMGITSIVLTVKPENGRANGLYSDAGFRVSHFVMELTL